MATEQKQIERTNQFSGDAEKRTATLAETNCTDCETCGYCNGCPKTCTKCTCKCIDTTVLDTVAYGSLLGTQVGVGVALKSLGVVNNIERAPATVLGGISSAANKAGG
jgi:hypothetical protein